MYTHVEILNLINDYISRMPFDRQPSTLYEPIRYVLSLGGKRIRPMLMMLVYDAYHGGEADKILSTAVALETYHNYTLLHDDLMDNADMRRSQPTVHKKWNANTAILSGDSMLVMAYELMAKCGEEHLKQMIDLFTETALQIGEGQQYDMDFETRTDVTEDEYINMIRLKTSVLLACATQMGGILAGAAEQDQQALYDFGVNLGLAFQLQDDYLDVYGDPQVFGKKNGGDIVSNKKTFMLINAYNRATPAQCEQLGAWIERKQFDAQEKIAAVTQLYSAIGIDQLALERIEHYFALAASCLDQVSVSEANKTVLRAYTDLMLHRQR